MSEQVDDKWLDELIHRIINTEKPQFDAEKWKQKYPNEFQILLSRAAKASGHPVCWAGILRSRIVKLAAAAVIIVALSIFLSRGKLTPVEPPTEPPPISQSPTRVISMMSMRMTYQQGGFDALDQQFRDTLDVLGSR